MTTRATRSFDSLWSDLVEMGRDRTSGGYRRYAWTPQDAGLREWFSAQAETRGLTLVVDRAGNQWAWWGDPDTTPGLVTGSHLDSVPDGGAYDGPLGVVSAFAALDGLKAAGWRPGRPVAVVNFADEEGARFGVPCIGSGLLTGSLDADRARALKDRDGVSLAEAMSGSGHDPAQVGPDREVLARVGTFVELHVEQGRRLIDTSHPVGVGTSIVPHGRWRLDLVGEANHAGTTRLADRHDAVMTLADVVHTTRDSAKRHGCVATVGKVEVLPNGVNAIASSVRAWLDARGPSAEVVRAVVAEVAAAGGVPAHEESFSDHTRFAPHLATRLATLLGDAPLLPSGAGHDAGILSAAGIETAMLFVRNPTGISHSPAENAETTDCHAGVEALMRVLADLSPAGTSSRG